MDASGMTFSEIINVDYTTSFTGLEVGAIEYYHQTLLMLGITIYLLVSWLLFTFITKRRRRVLKIIDDKDNQANQSSEPTRYDA